MSPLNPPVTAAEGKNSGADEPSCKPAARLGRCCFLSYHISSVAPCPLPCPSSLMSLYQSRLQCISPGLLQASAQPLQGITGVSHETRNRGSEATGKMSVRVNTAARTKAQQPGRLGLGETCFVSLSVLHPWVRGAPRPKARHMQGPAGGHLASSMATSREEGQPFT